MMRKRSRHAPSLRTRYVATTLALSAMVIAYAAHGYFSSTRINEEATRNLEAVATHLHAVNNIRYSVSNLYQLIDSFLLDPTQSDVPEKIGNRISADLASKLGLLIIDTDEPDLHRDFQTLRDDLLQLQDNVGNLFTTRLDPNLQYPALALSADAMGRLQDEINGRLAILTHEIEEGGFTPISEHVYPTLLKVQILWAKSISQVRIYLTNRLASFTTDILKAQARSLDGLFRELHSTLRSLARMYEQEDSFEGPAAITEATTLANEWYAVFQQVRRISESEGWREDHHMMQTLIIPTIERVFSTLDRIVTRLEQRQARATESIKASNQHQSVALIGIVALFVVFISILLLSMNFMVFRPISRVTEALKSRAFGKDSAQVHANLARETRDLVEAFQQMDREVNNREKALEHQALHDPLTSLPNRAMLNDRLHYQLLVAERDRTSLCLFLVDLDNFKDVNDSLGHQVGDSLLIQVGENLQKHLRPVDTISRLGGDEFAVLLPDVTLGQSERIAENLSKVLNRELTVGAYVINVSASIGISVFPEDATTAQELLQHADVAMYAAKRRRLDYSLYKPEEDTNSPDRIALISDLRTALDCNEMQLHFQPLKNMATGRIIGAEALLRWSHPHYGEVNPETIVEIAENVGIISRLATWVLEHAITECLRWSEMGFKLGISVNISVHNLNNDLFANQVKQILVHRGLESSRLTLEITETGVMENAGRAIDMLRQLSKTGIVLAIDDYGTGFSSLAYLKQLPVHMLKIDKSFVMHMDRNQSDATIVQSTIDLGHNLGLRVVAEGVENESVHQMLAVMGCDCSQGYLLSRPLSPADFASWLGTQEVELARHG